MPDWLIAALPVLLCIVVVAVPLLIVAHHISKPRKTRYSQWIE